MFDAIDGAIIKTDGETLTRENIHRSHKWDDTTRRDIFAVMQEPERLDDADFRADLENRIAARHTELVLEMLSAYGEKIDLIGFHGQTVLHAPRQKYSVQLGCARALADQTNLPVAHQFRQNDLAHGGEGRAFGTDFSPRADAAYRLQPAPSYRQYRRHHQHDFYWHRWHGYADRL